MGRQTSRIYFNGKDHKEIYVNKNYHNSANRNTNVLWEKILEPEVYEGFKFTSVIKSSSYQGPVFQAKGSFAIDWGDGSTNTYNLGSLEYVSHTYPYSSTKKTYTATLTGNLEDVSFQASNYIDSILTPLPPSLSGKSDFTNCFANIKTSNNTSGSFSIISELFKYCKNAAIFDNCFYGSNGLKVIPANLFKNNSNAQSFASCFRGCGITEIPSGLFSRKSLVTSFAYCFYGINAKIPNGLFDGCSSVTTLSNCFYLNKSITEIPDNLFDSMAKLEDISRCFFDCDKMTYVPFDLFNNCNELNNATQCFWGCESITSKVPELWNKETIVDSKGCYYNCSKAENYNDIPYWTWVSDT
jgi:hypothetical protein